jgi:hypothetical protein
VEPLPPDIDTALRIETKKAGVTPAFFFVRMPELLTPVVPCCVHFECVKKNFALHATFRHDALLWFQPVGLDIKTCVFLR